MKISTTTGVGLSAIALSLTTNCNEQQSSERPNVIYILADDLGYGDLGCYGQTMISTPNIDRLAAEGILYTQHYAGCTVSAPSRSTLLTGQHTGHTPIRGNRELVDQEGQIPLPDQSYTMAEMFKDAGYATGAYGKWGLGFPGSEGDPNMQGFDEFFGYNCQRQAHRYYPKYLWHNQEKVILEGNDFTNKVVYAPDVIHSKSIEFIEQQATEGRPFFAYLALVQPHAELIAPEDELLEMYRGKFVETPFVAKQPEAEYGAENFDEKYYASQAEPRATYAAMVARIDRYVGEVMALVDRLGIADNTIIIFSSDNGNHVECGHDPEYFNSNGESRGHKRDLTEGGIRTPMIARWSGKIKAGTTSDHISAFWDIMPTMIELAGAAPCANLDGISMVGSLLGGEQPKHDHLYWEYAAGSGGMALRLDNWKAIRMGLNKNQNAPIELYDIVKDPSETTNLAAEHPDIVAQIEAIMAQEHTPSDIYQFDFEK
ncbi:MAG: arylsulfatase [Rikenellaceae bacterium]